VVKIEIHLLHPATGYVVRMPVGVKTGVDILDTGSIELSFYFLRGVDENVGAVNE
jgi:hypothetical protein